MHFPTLPRRWRLSSSEAAKPPKYGRKPRKPTPASPSKLYRSVSFNGDPVFKVPQVPSRRGPNKESLNSTTASASSCPHCSSFGPKVDWKSRSLVNLQPSPYHGHAMTQRPPEATTASIFSNNLRSNSWRNLSLIGSSDPSAVLQFLHSFFRGHVKRETASHGMHARII